MATDKSTSATASASGSEVKEAFGVNNGPRFTDDQLADIQSFNDLQALFEAEGTVVDSFEDYGTGFDVVDSKDQLIGKPFIILEWRFNDGDYGVFVSCLVVTEDNRKMILNDGSSGIRAQLESVTKRREAAGSDQPQRGLMCKRGLTVSRYQYVDSASGESRPAATYYLA